MICFFCFKKTTKANYDVICYKDTEYYCAEELYCSEYHLDELKKIMFKIPYLNLFSYTSYFAEDVKNIEFIIAPKTHGVYVRSDIDYKNIKFNAYFYNAQSDPHSFTIIGQYSMNDLVAGEATLNDEGVNILDLIEPERHERSAIMLKSDDSLGLKVVIWLAKYNGDLYVLIENRIYYPTNNLINLLSNYQSYIKQ